MKSFKYLFAVALSLSVGQAFSQGNSDGVGYFLLQTGKEWVFKVEMRDYDDPRVRIEKTLYDRIEGDTLIGEALYWKLRHEDMVQTSNAVQTSRYLLREEGRRVFFRSMEEGAKEELLYDFSVVKGDRPEGFMLSVIDTDIIKVGDRLLKRVSLEYDVKWVEGVGSSYGLMHPWGPMLNDGVIRTLTECRENGVCVFTAADFQAEAYQSPHTDGLSDTTNERLANKNAAVYDLQGRRLTQKPQRGLHIQDGRKVLR